MLWKRRDEVSPTVLKSKCFGTLVDACDAISVVKLVQLHSRPCESTDELVKRLVCTFDTFRPTEQVMRRLSLMHNAYMGEGGLTEFSVATAHAAAIVSVMEESTLSKKRKSVTKRVSFPDRTKPPLLRRT